MEVSNPVWGAFLVQCLSNLNMRTKQQAILLKYKLRFRKSKCGLKFGIEKFKLCRIHIKFTTLTLFKRTIEWHKIGHTAEQP